MKLKLALLGGGLLLAGANAMACYTVYDAGSRVVYQGTEPPVDMSLPLHQALAQRFPRGAQMVFNQSATCQPVGLGQVPRPTAGDVPPNTIRLERTNARPSSSAPSPLFTDRQTAERAQLPHTTVAGDIVMVPPVAAERALQAAVTVLPASTFAAAPAAPDTRAMGAGPARPAVTAPRVAPSGSRPNVVITEMRDPPLTVIESEGGIRIFSPQ